MPKLRTLSGQELLRIFAGFGFQLVSHRGSHMKLRRVLADGTRENLTIVRHHELDKGTPHAIFRQALRYILEAELRPYFYTGS